jgi:hypothetical protein
MANLVDPTNVRTSGNGWYSKYNIYLFYTYSATPNYVHFKTNVSANTEKIFMIEAIGYNYGGASAIRAAWGVYTTGGGGTTPKGLQTIAGLTADGVYTSSDGYACIRAYAGSLYFAGWILNAHVHPSYSVNITITAASQNSTSGNYY